MNNLLFVYGTLLDNDNEFAVFLNNNSSSCSSGQLKGKLYDIGECPGAIFYGDDENYIYGSILELINIEKVLPVVDDYEGYGDDQIQPNEFIRALANVETETGLLTCWVYLYNLPAAGLPVIESGRYNK